MGVESPIPYDSPVLQPGPPDALTGKLRTLTTMGRDWIQWLLQLAGRINRSAQVLRSIALTTPQAAAILATPIDIASVSAGYYRISYVVRVTQPASVSSAVQVSIGFVLDGVTQSIPGANLTGNTTTTIESNELFIKADASSPLTYAATYASVGGTPMQFLLDVHVEEVPSL